MDLERSIEEQGAWNTGTRNTGLGNRELEHVPTTYNGGVTARSSNQSSARDEEEEEDEDQPDVRTTCCVWLQGLNGDHPTGCVYGGRCHFEHDDDPALPCSWRNCRQHVARRSV
eukprot:gene9278-biopygen2158